MGCLYAPLGAVTPSQHSVEVIVHCGILIPWWDVPGFEVRFPVHMAQGVEYSLAQAMTIRISCRCQIDVKGRPGLPTLPDLK